MVDIIDEHQPFKNQWSKRKVFYKKQNYKIIGTDSYNYDSNISKWKIIYQSINNEQKPCFNKNNNNSDNSSDDNSDEDTKNTSHLERDRFQHNKLFVFVS